MAHLFPGRPHFLTTALDRFSEAGQFLTGREAILDENEVLALSGHDATLWDEMIRLELVISSSKALRTAKVTEHGGGFVAGEGDRAEELRRLADGIWNLPARNTIEMEVIESWAYGFVIHEAVGVREFSLDGKTYMRPRRLYRRPASHYAFTSQRDLVLLAGFGRKAEDQPFRTASLDFHPDMLRWLVSTYGTTKTPYGAPVLGDVWVFYRLLGDFWTGLKSGLLASNGVLEISEVGLSQETKASDARIQLSNARRMAKEVAKELRDSGILYSVGGFKGEIKDTKASGEAWLAAIRELKSDVRERILGSTLPQSMPAGGPGSFAAAKVQEHAPEAFGRSDANEASDSITDYVTQWVKANRPGDTFDDEELPRWESKMGTVPSLETVQAFVAMGAPVDAVETAKQLKVTLILDPKPGDLILEQAMPQLVAAPAPGDEEKTEDETRADEETEEKEDS